jgi:predicted  nucleic acid-binding Zn-ribbon protein
MLSELRRLQDVEMQLVAIRRNREGKSRRVDAQQNKVRQIDVRIDENRRSARAQQVKIDELSLDVASREDSVDKHRQALNKAKTNKEYAAILTAMNTEKADSSKVETEVLQLMEELTRIKSEGAGLEAERERLLGEVAGAQRVLAEFDAQSKAELDRLAAEKSKIAAGVEPASLLIFDRAAQRHEGEAMASVTKLRAKGDEWACGGCNLKITLDMVNALATRDEVRLCGACGRILFIEQGAMKAKS